MELMYWEKQLILFTKGHFKREAELEEFDLKWFPANHYGLGIEQVSLDSVYSMALDLHQKLVANDCIPFNLDKFLKETFKEVGWRRNANCITQTDITDQLLRDIRWVTIKELGVPLGPADEALKQKLHSEEWMLFTQAAIEAAK